MGRVPAQTLGRPSLTDIYTGKTVWRTHTCNELRRYPNITVSSVCVPHPCLLTFWYSRIPKCEFWYSADRRPGEGVVSFKMPEEKQVIYQDSARLLHTIYQGMQEWRHMTSRQLSHNVHAGLSHKVHVSCLLDAPIWRSTHV
jgi:hypothetical protein